MIRCLSQFTFTLLYPFRSNSCPLHYCNNRSVVDAFTNTSRVRHAAWPICPLTAPSKQHNASECQTLPHSPFRRSGYMFTMTQRTNHVSVSLGQSPLIPTTPAPKPSTSTYSGEIDIYLLVRESLLDQLTSHPAHLPQKILRQAQNKSPQDFLFWATHLCQDCRHFFPRIFSLRN